MAVLCARSIVLSVFLGLSPMAGSPASVAAIAASPISAQKPAAGAKTHQATGEVLSVTATEFVILHARGRARQRMAFTLSDETSGRGELAKGKRVTVFYREVNGRRIAVRIRAPRTHGSAHATPGKNPHL